jgi:hypothetical protein
MEEWRYTPPFLTSAQDGGEWSASHPGHITPGEKSPSTHSLGGLAEPRASLDDVEKRKSLEPVRNWTLANQLIACHCTNQAITYVPYSGTLLLLYCCSSLSLSVDVWHSVHALLLFWFFLYTATTKVSLYFTKSDLYNNHFYTNYLSQA